MSLSTCVNLIVYPSIWIWERPETPNHSTISYLSMFLLFAFHLCISLVNITFCCTYHHKQIISTSNLTISARKPRLLNYRRGSWAINPRGTTTPVTNLYIHSLYFDVSSSPSNLRRKITNVLHYFDKFNSKLVRKNKVMHETLKQIEEELL